MKRLLILPFLCLPLTGCVLFGISHSNRTQPSETRYQEAVRSWIDRPVSEVIASWGKPSRIINMDDGVREYRWLRIEEYVEGVSTHYYDPVDKKMVYEPADQRYISCRTILRVDPQGIVRRLIDDSGNVCNKMQPWTTRQAN